MSIVAQVRTGNKQGAEAQERSVAGKDPRVGSTVKLQKNAGSVFLWFDFSFSKCSAWFMLLISGWRPNRPLSHGWKEGVPPGQPTRHYSLAGLWGQAALLGPKQVDFVSMDPAGSLWGVHGTQPYKVGTYNQLCLGDFHRVQGSLLLFSPPELSQGQHTGPMSSPAGLVTPWGRCADGSGHSKAHTRHILAAPDPGGSCMLSQEREI